MTPKEVFEWAMAIILIVSSAEKGEKRCTALN